MQYFRPAAPNHNVGDCMPFFHDGVFHLYYLLDEGHHHAKGGLGAHQWAHASTTDLINWEHHPLAIPITDDRECSICTGAIIHHEGTFYAFYATRLSDWSEHLSLAVSCDGIHFEKTEPNPFASPPEGYTKSFRDPHVLRDPATGRFHMIVTASLADHAVWGRGGCLAQLVSEDLRHWEQVEPFLIPGYRGDPECAESFEWNGWYYLVFSNDGVARYRMSRSPLGPWQAPAVDTLDGAMARVMKSAAFTGNRRLGVAFLPDVDGGRDDGGWLYGGNAIFRELVQHPDGTLGTCFPAEMMPAAGEPISLTPDVLSGAHEITCEGLRLSGGEGLAVACAQPLPQDVRIEVEVHPGAGARCFGLCLRASADYQRGYELRFLPCERKVEMRRTDAGLAQDNGAHCITGVAGLGRPFRLEVVMQGDILDVCVDGRRCMVNRFPEATGDALHLFCHSGEAEFRGLTVRPLG